ncbi:MAG: DUF5052 family protein [Tissierellia bacterium]|nr:DUF5052 family protein [Tissierellia bacterium]
MKNKKRIIATLSILTVLIVAVSCQPVKRFFKGLEESLVGLDSVVETYDRNSQKIDSISGKSVKIERDTKFDTDTSDSSVIKVTIGGREIHHVGSSLIAREKSVVNYFDDYSKKVDVDKTNRSIPILNSLVNEYKNDFFGKSKVVLIRSQSGNPLATFIGDKVSIKETDVPKSTGLYIDGDYVFIYRCDYTIYDMDLLEN